MAEREVAGPVPVEGDLLWPMMPGRAQGFAEKCLCGSGSTCAPQKEGDRLAVFVDGAEQIVPTPIDLDVGLIDPPGGVDALGHSAPALFEFRHVPDRPLHQKL